MAKQLTEEELNIRRTARRRLIGAVALALAVVVFLPMVLDSEPKPDGQDIELRIPDPEKAGTFVPGAAPSAVNEMTSLDDPAVEPAQAETPASSVPKTEPAAPAVEPKPVPAAVQAAGATSSQPVKQAATSPASAKPGAANAKAAKPAGGSFVVQVGAFSTVVKANSEVDKLKLWGFTAYTEQVGSATRVRIGPFAERGKADEVRRALEDHGLHPVVTGVK